jgi:hypothetical protein
MAERNARPTDLAVLVALANCFNSFACADEVAGKLRALGFSTTAQQAASALGRLSKSPAHFIEIQDGGSGCWEYALLPTARKYVTERFKAVRP